ncbi:hypothetical protein [Butyrivibrio proteoclasticus]|nr:hypothetical protein [Butyrivibrio proteoclasticus]
MANRVLNDVNYEHRGEMLNVLRNSITRDDIPDSTKEAISEFLDYQGG